MQGQAGSWERGCADVFQPPLKGCTACETTASFSLSGTNGPCSRLVQAPHFRSLCFLNKSSVICETKVCCLFPEKKVNKSRDTSWQWGRSYRDAFSLRTLLFSLASAMSAVPSAKQHFVHCSLGNFVPVVPWPLILLVKKSMISTWKLAVLACLVVCRGIFKQAYLYTSCNRHRADATDSTLQNNTSGFSGLVVCIFNR